MQNYLNQSFKESEKAANSDNDDTTPPTIIQQNNALPIPPSQYAPNNSKGANIALKGPQQQSANNSLDNGRRQ